LAALFGTVLGVVAILVGQIFEGGSVLSLLHFTSAFIVLAGTAGATFLAFPSSDIQGALSGLPKIYFSGPPDLEPLIDEIHQVAQAARKEGILGLEAFKATLKDPLFKRGVSYAISGYEVGEVESILKAEIDGEYHQKISAAKVMEGAGGYAPTIGIIGAVLGLIQVMTRLDDPSQLGSGVGAAFVATLYGLALSHLFLLPWGNRLRRQADSEIVSKQIVRDGIVGIMNGANPTALKERLLAYQTSA